jgi:hypothetical protein
MSKKIAIVTTFSDSGYEDYGKLFLESCSRYLNPLIEVIVYKDNVDLPTQKNLKILNLESSIPDLTEFKKRNSFRDEANTKFQFQSIRFSHKIYALYHAAITTDARYLIWLDSDTELYDSVGPEYFRRFLPEGAFVGYLGRAGEAFSECGFMIYDLHNPHARDFFDRFKWYYDTDELYKLREWHDSYIFDVVRKEFESSGKIKTVNLSSHVNKHHFNSVLDGYIMHLKGDRKHKRAKMMEKALRRKGELAKIKAPW